ncbi:5'-nucleotidase [Slackia heliotrinireducens]|uniref:Predicted phosphatase n=1 Tax=Slackia heliotrinireducens (strain ATCC 29202 / DSM 20476 / NCTC 11029 / RHS 1) TaxID=471855 RepID=C7N4D6_SLAHD|nr:HAD hydrolase-like protein [Slackia heliotrinireducens]ACV21771.1 predicted phosphatase [Slackia heliotrinireducens DSM 20476]VEG99439.1 5'-nucleotidase [Slackia heliotrinireducens]
MALSTVVFDFDGTLHDSMQVYPRALKAVCQGLMDRGLVERREMGDGEIAGYIGLTTKEMWQTFAPDLDEATQRQSGIEVGRTMDELIANGESKLYDGVPDMLQRVFDMGLDLVFLSNCRIAYQEVCRKAFGMDAWFSAYYNSEEAHDLPKEVIFERIAEVFDGDYLIVGDRDKDLQIAQVHGLPSIGCLYGYGSREELACATYLVESPGDVANIIETLL